MYNVRAAGYNFVHRSGWEISRPNGFRHHLLVHIRNPFYFEEKGQTVFCPHPAYLVYRPADPEHFYRKDGLYADDWIHFDMTESDGDESICDAGISFGVPVILSDVSEITALHQILEAENLRRGPHCGEISDQILRAMILKIGDQSRAEREKRDRNTNAANSAAAETYRQQFNQLRSGIYHYNPEVRNATVASLAERVNLSTSYFQHIYKSLYGVPVTVDLIRARVRYAEYLLVNSSLPIGDIAEACGYRSIEHFNRQFRSINGCTPTEFQQNSR